MIIPFKLEEFEGRDLAVKAAGMFSTPQLYENGKLVRPKKRKHYLRNNTGKQVIIELKYNYIDPVPKVSVDGVTTFELVKPLKWYEYVWIGWPVILLVAGGVLGALCGGFAVLKNARIFRSNRTKFAKYFLSGLLSFGLAFLFLIIAGALHMLVEMIPTCPA